MTPIETVLAYVILDPEGNEVIPTVLDEAQGVVIPLLATSEKAASAMRPTAQLVASAMGKPLRLVRFTRLMEGETILPEAMPDTIQVIDTPTGEAPLILKPGDPGFNPPS